MRHGVAELSPTSPLGSALHELRLALGPEKVTVTERPFIVGENHVEFETVVNDPRPKIIPAEAGVKVRMFEDLLSGYLKRLFPQSKTFKTSEAIVAYVKRKLTSLEGIDDVELYREALFYTIAIERLREKFNFEKHFPVYVDQGELIVLEALIGNLEDITFTALEKQRNRVLQLAMTPEQWVIGFPSAYEDLFSAYQYWNELFEFFDQITPR